jgi:hypothetical protein
MPCGITTGSRVDSRHHRCTDHLPIDAPAGPEVARKKVGGATGSARLRGRWRDVRRRHWPLLGVRGLLPGFSPFGGIENVPDALAGGRPGWGRRNLCIPGTRRQLLLNPAAGEGLVLVLLLIHRLADRLRNGGLYRNDRALVYRLVRGDGHTPEPTCAPHDQNEQPSPHSITLSHLAASAPTSASRTSPLRRPRTCAAWPGPSLQESVQRRPGRARH